MEGTHTGTVREETAAHRVDSHWRSSGITVSCERDTTLEQGKSVRSSPPEEEGTTETTCDELGTIPVPHHPAPLRAGDEVGKLRVKLNLGFKLHIMGITIAGSPCC